MKKIFLIPLILLFFGLKPVLSQSSNDTTIYLITCAPGTATYSVWGHSALRVVMPGTGADIVYNWGVFDFSTPNFAWKFAKGRLNYMLGAYSWNSFLQDYMMENRSVWAQEVNLEPVEKLRLMLLINENMKPENRFYRYDFFYDDCSTRIRDLIEKILGSKLIYPPDEMKNAPTFREKISEYTRNYAWLRMGIDFLMGTPGERKTTFREEMFLPDDLKDNLSQAVINRDRKMIPLLQNAETVLEFPAPQPANPFYTGPMFIFTLVFVIVTVLSVVFKKSVWLNYLDIALFLFFSILAILMIFFGFFTDHDQMRMNLNILWFNPFIILCLASLVWGREGLAWFRVVFFLSILIVPVMLIAPGIINTSFVPVVFILMVRSSARAGFEWNPLSI
jgi:hypothetical protein